MTLSKFSHLTQNPSALTELREDSFFGYQCLQDPKTEEILRRPCIDWEGKETIFHFSLLSPRAQTTGLSSLLAVLSQKHSWRQHRAAALLMICDDPFLGLVSLPRGY